MKKVLAVVLRVLAKAVCLVGCALDKCAEFLEKLADKLEDK